MLSSTSGEEEDTPSCYNNHRPKTLRRRSSSSSSSPPPFSPLNNNYIHHQISNTLKPKTMEEVWKDINLASLNGHSSADQDLSLTPRLHNPPPPPRPRHNHSNSGFILQDLFTRPFRGDPPARVISSTTNSSATTTSKNRGDHNNNTELYGSLTPATILSLNSGAPGFDFLNNSEDLVRNSSHLQNHNSTSNVSSFITCFDGLDSSSGWASFGKRRAQDSDHSSSCDRRHKRMIKNRESAARSRARKQAYTHQLEAAVDQLNAENARLRREQEELCLAAAYQLRRKHTLHRTSTAPF